MTTEIRTEPTYSDEEAERIFDILHFDPLAEAEQITGHSYKEEGDEGKATQSLGMLMHRMSNKQKESLLTSMGDTTFRNDLGRYIGIIENYGFRRVLDIPFQRENGHTYHQYVYWHDEYGLLLEFDTYYWSSGNEVTVNGGNVHYQWVPDDRSSWRLTSTGAMRSKDWDDPNELRFWEGSHDCREGLIFALEQLRTHGRFLPKWIKTQEKRWPGVYIIHHGDKDLDSDVHSGWDSEKVRARNEERYAMLPADVREATGL